MTSPGKTEANAALHPLCRCVWMELCVRGILDKFGVGVALLPSCIVDEGDNIG